MDYGLWMSNASWNNIPVISWRSGFWHRRYFIADRDPIAIDSS